MIPQIKEIEGKFPKYATLSQATVTLNDMGDKTITTQIKIDGGIAPDFSYDWEVEFQGERYIQPLREPQASKGNESICSVIDLTFYHKTIYDLKRYFFVEMASTGSGTAMADKYIADLNVNLESFCDVLQGVLDYYYEIGYFEERITINLKGKGTSIYAEEKQYVQIQYTHIWDVVQKIYEIFGVRWSIEGREIKIGYPTEEVAHTFEYGFEGGLLKVERQVQSADIRNSLLGRGGSKNLPYRYFKDTDPENPTFPADPDAIPELANIYFAELRGKTFRDYVKGWKAKHYGGAPMSEPTEAYTKGYTDTTFNPIEYVEDKDSIDKYGLLQGGLENQEDIYPTIQGVEVDGLGRVDEIVDAEQVEVDDSAENAISDIVKITPMPSVSKHFSPQLNGGTSTPLFRYKIGEFTIPEGFVGINIDKSNLSYAFDYVKDSLGRYTWGTNPHIPIDFTPADTNIIPLFDFTTYAVGVFKSGTNFNSSSDFYYNSIKGVLSSGDYYIAIQGYFESTNEDDWEGFGSCYWNFALNSASVKLVKGFIVGENTQDKIFVSKESEGKRNIHIGAITVPSEGATMVDIPIGTSTNTDIEGEYIVSKKIKVVDSEGKDVSSINIPEGKFDIYVEVNIENLSQYDTEFTITAGKGVVVLATDSTQWQPTFEIYVKNIWGTTRNEGENEEAYTNRVWTPILGDREGDEAKVVFTTGWLAGHSDYEFKIVKGGVAYDNSAILDGVTSEWRLTLAKSDAELEATGKWIPSTTQQAVKGDKFFFIGIDMPHEYTLWAEQAVDNYKSDQLLETAHIKPTWVVQTDKVRLNQLQPNETEPLLNALKIGNSLRLADTRFTNRVAQTLYLQSVTYNWQEGTNIVPDVEVVLSDKVTTSTNPVAKLQGEVDALTKQVGSISNIQQVVRAVGDKLYLRKDGFDEVSNSATEFNKLVSSRGYRQGAVGGNGWGLRSEQGKGIIEVDKLIVRDEMQVNSLVVNQVSAIGGKEILSAASIVCTKVEYKDDGTICYFDQKQGSVSNLFVVGDIAYSQVYNPNNITVKYYKREVKEVGDNYILLSLEGDGNGAPQVGDVIAQYGNTDTEKYPDRQYVIIRDVIGGGYERMLSDLNSVNAEGTEYYFAGRMVGDTPRWFVGDANQYLEFSDGKIEVECKKVGMTSEGESSDSIRFWAGVDNTEKENAPFKVLQDGTILATKAEIEGTVNATRGTFNNGVFNNVTIKGSVSNPFASYIGAKIKGRSGAVYTRDMNQDDGGLYAWVPNNDNIVAFTEKTIPEVGNAITRGRVVIDDVIEYTNEIRGDKNGIGRYDNLVLPNENAKTYSPEELTWDISNSGRMIRIVNSYYNEVDEQPKAKIKLTAPDRMYFFEDGERYSNLIVSREVIEMIGYGDDDTFYGWIILNRKDVCPEYSYGVTPKVLYQGIISNGKLSKFWTPFFNRGGGSMTAPTFYSEQGVLYIPLPEDNNMFRGVEDVENWVVLCTNAVVKSRSYSPPEAGKFYGTLEIQFNLVANNMPYFAFQIVSTADWQKL